MFVSVDLLHEDMGVDKTIARFFVDRKVPGGNAYWEKRLLYVGRGNGYIFIPVYYDLLFRIGIPVRQLLAEEHIQFMEKILHLAMLAESRQINHTVMLEGIKKMFIGRIKNESLYSELLFYLEQPVIKPKGRLGMITPALNRGDAFLFVLCDLNLSEQEINLAIQYWYALVTTYLLMDDVYDYKHDKLNQEESSIVELGDGHTGFENAMRILDNNCNILDSINRFLSVDFKRRIADLQDLMV